MQEIIQTIKTSKIIAIVRGVESSRLIPLAEALYDGGIRLMEITYSADGSVSDAETADNIGSLTKHFKGKMYIGAGTVLTEDQVKKTFNDGGQFIISPNTDSEVIKYTKKLGMVSIPGALTPSEAETAKLAGADFVKLFPITSMGASYVKAITAPLSHIPFLAVGGVTPQNVREYLDAGVCGFGIGSNIINKEYISSGDYGKITELAREYFRAINGETGE